MRPALFALCLGLTHVAAMTLAERPALADEPSEDALARARKLFEDATRAQEAGDCKAALDLYGQVLDVVVSPTTLLNVGACRDHLGEVRAAVAAYERAASVADERGQREQGDEARARAARLRPQIPKVIVRVAATTKGAEVKLDGAVVDPSTLGALEVDPGPHTLLVRSDQHERIFEVAFDMARAGSRAIDVDLGPERVAVAPPPPEVRLVPRVGQKSYLPAIVSGSATALLGGAAVVTGALGAGKQSTYDELNARPTPENLAERDDLRSSGRALYVANAIFIGAAVLSAAATVYFLVRPPLLRDARRPEAWLPMSF